MEIRLTEPNDEAALRALIDRSVRGLQTADYSPEQILGALGTVFGLDVQLICDGTYFVAEIRSKPVGCIGWSKRKVLFGANHHTSQENALLDPRNDPAKIRAFFVDPIWSRHGIGTAILAASEAAAFQAGFRCYELGSTLTGAPLYLAHGYPIVERMEVPLPNGYTLPIIRIAKEAGKK